MLAFCVALLAAPAVSDSAVSRHGATNSALAALGSRNGSSPVIVFRLGKTVRAGARVTEAGAAKRVVAKARERSYFYYEDSGPFRAYPHAGRVALVGVRSGKVRLSRTLSRAPLVNGRLPGFLASATNYSYSRNRVFARLASTPAPFVPGTPSTQDAFAPITSNQPPKADPQSRIVKQGVPKHVTLTGSDIDGDMLLFFITQQPNHGTLSGTPPDMVYTPNAGYLGPDKFAFKATDGDQISNTANVYLRVVPLGSPPSVTTSAGCTTYLEEDPAVPVDSALTVTDPDDTTLDSARVRISANFEGGDDLVFTDQNGISGSYDDGLGVLTLSGTASLANYQAALRTLRYRNLDGGSPAATKDVQFTVNDAGSDSAPATKQVCISEGDSGTDNNRPVGEPSEGALNYTENDGPVPIDSGFSIFDPDSTTLSGATVKFTPSAAGQDDELGGGGGDPVFNYFPDQDSLAFADQNGITGSYDDVNGVLTLSGTASVADYQTAIQSVTYENSSENPSDALRTIKFQVTDSSGAHSKATTRGIFVTPVNDAPTATPSDGATSFTEGDPATPVDSGLTVGDVDDTNLEGAQVRISDGMEPEDALAYSDQLGISGTYDADTGVLTLSGTASVADYQTALRSVEFSNTGENPGPSRSVEFVVNDGDLDSTATTKAIAVTAVNDKPVLSSTGTTLSYTEGDAPVVVDPGISASDVDSSTLSGATVQVTDGFSLSEDLLNFTDQGDITGVRDPDTGILTLSGTASVADYEAALRSITYENGSHNPSTVTRTVAFQVDDGAANDNLSDQATRDVSITAVNDAPAVVTSDGSTSYVGSGQLEAVDSGLTVSDVDDTNLESARVTIASGLADGDELVYADQAGITGVYDTGTGVLDLTGSASVADYETALRSVQYRHTGDNPTGARGVEFTVNDGDLDSSAVTTGIETNDPPVITTTATALAYTAGDGAVPVDPGVAITDADSTTLAGATVHITENASPDDKLVFADGNGITGFLDDETGVLQLSGTASIADYEAALRSVTYENTSATPTTDTRTVTFTVDDGAPGNNASDPATRAIEVAPAP